MRVEYLLYPWDCLVGPYLGVDYSYFRCYDAVRWDILSMGVRSFAERLSILVDEDIFLLRNY